MEQAERDGQQLQFALEQSETAYTKLEAERDALKALCGDGLPSVAKRGTRIATQRPRPNYFPIPGVCFDQDE